MLTKKRKAAAKCVLVLYVFINATFSLAHRDYVPLEGELFYTPTNALYHPLDINDDDLVCPAHNFAQSTTSIPASSLHLTFEVVVFFLQTQEQIEHFIEPIRNHSTRAPPQA